MSLVRVAKGRTTLANQNISYAFTYDVNNRLTGVTDSFYRTVTYQYDAAGNRTIMITPEGLTTTYTYNNAGRLTGTGNFAGNFSLTYDAAGRRTQLAYPNGTTAAYTYDANGNRIQKTEGGITTTYTFDDENRLVQVVRGGDTIIYAYDPLGRRIAKSVNNVVTWYVYDGNAIIAAYDLSGTVTARYAHGLNSPVAIGASLSCWQGSGLRWCDKFLFIN